MARYIDAEKCPCKGCGITYCNENCKKYYAWLDGCDYDVEAKVAELKKIRDDENCDSVKMADCLSFGDCQLCLMNRAISIVRNGGKE